MGTIIVALALIAAMVLYAYLKFPPLYADVKLVNVYNMMTLGVCLMLCVAWFFDIESSWKDSINDAYWLPVAIAGALVIEIGFLGICFLLRNFWIFKPPRRPGSGGFGF